jgi:G:T-mismatch repair DNA endonuclease (very short patch repair protein)
MVVELLEHYMDTNQEHCRGSKPIVTGDARLRFFLVASYWHRSAVVLLTVVPWTTTSEWAA